MIKKVITSLILSISLFLISCNTGPSPEEVARAEAMAVAQLCYDRLLSGDYEGFLAFRQGMDSLPDSYRRQMIDTYRQYIDTEERMHRGIKQATATRALMDTTMNVMQVFMLLDYGNGSQEEIVVPMVCTQEGQWKMK
jgi:hypothetical protein